LAQVSKQMVVSVTDPWLLEECDCRWTQVPVGQPSKKVGRDPI
jgi:hypothetical protein